MGYYLENYPRLINLDGVPTITYVIESWSGDDLSSVEPFVRETLEKNPVVPDSCVYMIAFAWRLKEKRMLDLWVFTQNDVHEPSGPLVRVHLFSEFNVDHASEIASGSTLLVLGLEEQHRRDSKDLAAFFETRPPLPEAFVVKV